jgi:hypothetical protein
MFLLDDETTFAKKKNRPHLPAINAEPLARIERQAGDREPGRR